MKKEDGLSPRSWKPEGNEEDVPLRGEQLLPLTWNSSIRALGGTNRIVPTGAQKTFVLSILHTVPLSSLKSNTGSQEEPILSLTITSVLPIKAPRYFCIFLPIGQDGVPFSCVLSMGLVTTFLVTLLRNQTYLKNGGSIFLRNVCIRPQNYTMSQPRKQPSKGL
jgi:hypothetical protein